MEEENQTRSQFTFIIFQNLNFNSCHESFNGRITNWSSNEYK